MTISTTAMFHILAALLILSIGVAGALFAALMSHHDGDGWTTIIRQGFKGLGATITVLTLLYGIAVVAL
ncbi:hypothetical protein [Nocardia lijiangensis]|uniref:hypothetical protein n=1 Tax=Nocardia lijiangensis TaxID=299618 RepID=UPI000837A752|nr:hypothetical protein [Nocardia lijiangensis]